MTLFKNCLRNFDLSINMVLVNGGHFALHRQRNSCKSFSERDKKKMAGVISKTQVSDPGPSWPSCLTTNMPAVNSFNLHKFKISENMVGKGKKCWKLTFPPFSSTGRSVSYSEKSLKHLYNILHYFLCKTIL